MLRDSFQIAWGNIKGRKLRSLLTTLGIIIGVAAIIGLISVGQGLEKSVTEQFEQIGSQRIYVMPKTTGGFNAFGMGQGLTDKDFEVLDKMTEFEFVTPYYYQTANLEYRGERQQTFVLGIPTDDTEIRLEAFGTTLEQGRYFIDGEKNVAILGQRVAHNNFDREIRINTKVEAKEIELKVIGILDSIGNEQDDSSIWVPIDVAREMFDQDEALSFIEAQVKTGVDIDQLKVKIERNLKRARDNENFEVQTPEQLMQQFGDILLIVQIVLTGIAAISLVVGSIGILNSMYTSVLERTKEIGIMKSIGAGNWQIMLIFLLESGIIGMTGGIIGSLIGSVMGIGMSAAAAQAGYSFLEIGFDPMLFIFGVGFATIVGMVSGFFPARQASKLQPVEALRVGK